MIKIESLHKFYNKGKPNELHALKGISLQINDGEAVGIVGRSGAGKSTILHIIGCIDGFDRGEVEIDGKSIMKLNDRSLAQMRNEKIGIVLQDFALIPDYSVIDNVSVPLYFAKIPGRRRKQKAMLALERVGLAELADKNINELSGGQKQRVAIARAIANNPSYLLADEPTGALDSQTAAEILGVLKVMNINGITLVIVTHEKEVTNICHRIITVNDGLLVN